MCAHAHAGERGGRRHITRIGRAILSTRPAVAAGIRFSESLDGDAAVIFRHACYLGCEGIVSKRRDATYRSGRSKAWLKIKTPQSAAMPRLEE